MRTLDRKPGYIATHMAAIVYVIPGALRREWCDLHLVSEAACTIYTMAGDRITPLHEWRDCDYTQP